jgi:hypothetical protein
MASVTCSNQAAKLIKSGIDEERKIIGSFFYFQKLRSCIQHDSSEFALHGSEGFLVPGHSKIRIFFFI